MLPIWVVSLKRSKNRRAMMARQLARHKMDYEWIDAVDGSKLEYEYLRKIYSPFKALLHCGYFLRSGVIGCYLSHLRCWERMVEQNLEEVLILEDDIVFDDRLLKVLSHRHLLPSGWDRINLKSDIPSFPPLDLQLTDQFRLALFRSSDNSTTSYLLSQAGAKKLLEKVYPISRPVDELMGRRYITRSKVYTIVPDFIDLAPVDSVIHTSKNNPDLDLLTRKYQLCEKVLKFMKILFLIQFFRSHFITPIYVCYELFRSTKFSFFKRVLVLKMKTFFIKTN